MNDIKFCPAVSCSQHLPVFPHCWHIGTFFVLKIICGSFVGRIWMVSSFALQYRYPAPSLFPHYSDIGTFFVLKNSYEFLVHLQTFALGSKCIDHKWYQLNRFVLPCQAYFILWISIFVYLILPFSLILLSNGHTIST